MTSVTLGMTTVEVRYFAAAAEAAGCAGESITLAPGATVGQLLSALQESHDNPRLSRILDISSVLVDGVGQDDRGTPLTPGRQQSQVRVDVLPPFAGG